MHLSNEQSKVLNLFKQWIVSERRFVNPNIGCCRLYEKYIKVRNLYPQCYRNLDINDTSVYDLMCRGYIFPLLERDRKGRVVIFGRSAMFRQKHGHRPTDLFRALTMTLETLLDDEENQVNGFVYIFDQEGVTLTEITYLGVWQMQKLLKSGEHSLPVKHKEIHWLHLSPLISTIFYFIASFLTEKLRHRLYFHRELSDLHECIPATILPLEYGGSVPWKLMSEKWIKRLQTNREKLLSLDAMSVK
ncbi:uncharacterized protein B4U79_06023 [Dinothrombium tinctorium]|uniref:CRAL-TRIO domain-containing protein n=1 Tax=Dinothrombium tinctorium TaxID=1965070 RepID=A0A443RDC8_9ACAR|nr:uncharacterized protein B4U79_06023 [Dinothrombium tinctorium]